MIIFLRVVLIFLLVALLAGGIAMLGNQLGRKIGRKKMTVFGMRPRHTSIFITTATGSIIAVLTLGLAMIGSQDVRDLITGSEERVKKLQQREAQLLARVQELAEDVRRGAIIWNYEQRIALNTIPAGADERAVTNIIGVLLRQANDLSIIKNNRIAVRQNKQPFDLDTRLVEYTPEESRQWIQEQTNLDKPVGLWVVVTENCLFGDPVPVTVESFPVEVIFQSGETVYKTEIVPSEVLLDWHLFLQELKAVALRKGMIEINDSLGGEITGTTLREISQTVDRYDGKIRLRAVANRDLYQSSNLDVSIEVEPVGE
jgi:Protein of unknown function (DUF3084)